MRKGFFFVLGREEMEGEVGFIRRDVVWDRVFFNIERVGFVLFMVYMFFF